MSGKIDLTKFPLYKNDGKPLFIFNENIKRGVQILNKKIESGEYKHITNPCLCKNAHPEKDILLAQKDMWGITADNVICSKCGLIRSETVLDDKSLGDLYETEYKNIYYDSPFPNDHLFQSQKDRGLEFYSLLKRLDLLSEIKSVFDYGCAMGGVLMPFFESKMEVSGCDYGDDFLDFGRKKGLNNLYHGEIREEKTALASQDLIILSHVMEHFLNPLESVQRIVDYITPGKFLLVEVPGLYGKPPYKYYPAWHLQKTHIYNFFFKDFLKVFFTKLGLEVVYGDERCTFVLRVPSNYNKVDLSTLEIFDSTLKDSPQKVLQYFWDSYIKEDRGKLIHPLKTAKLVLRLSEMFGLKSILGMLHKPAKNWTN